MNLCLCMGATLPTQPLKRPRSTRPLPEKGPWEASPATGRHIAPKSWLEFCQNECLLAPLRKRRDTTGPPREDSQEAILQTWGDWRSVCKMVVFPSLAL